MGMYDTFYGEIKCPICGKLHKIDEQTKSYECMLNEFLLGDYIDKGNANYIYSIDGYCNHKWFSIGAVIRKGQLVKYITGNELQDADSRDYDNIEDGYQRRINYETACIEAEGTPNESDEFDYNTIPLNNGYRFTAFSVEWEVIELFRKTANSLYDVKYFYIIQSKEHDERILEVSVKFQGRIRLYKQETVNKFIKQYPNLYEEVS